MKLILLLLLLMPQKLDPATALQRVRMQLTGAGIVSLELPKAIELASQNKTTELHAQIIKVADEITVATYEKPDVLRRVMLDLQAADVAISVAQGATRGQARVRAWVCYDLKTRKAKATDYCRSHPKDSMFAIPK